MSNKLNVLAKIDMYIEEMQEEIVLLRKKIATEEDVIELNYAVAKGLQVIPRNNKSISVLKEVRERLTDTLTISLDAMLSHEINVLCRERANQREDAHNEYGKLLLISVDEGHRLAVRFLIRTQKTL